MGKRVHGDQKLYHPGECDFDKSLLQSEVKELKCAQAENQVEPENAYVALEGSEFTIVPETEGSKLKVKEAYKALDTAISGSQTTIDLGSTPEYMQWQQ